MNKVLLYVSMIAAITGMPSCYASQNLRAGDMFDRLLPEQQIDFVKQVPFEITLQILKHLPQETKNLVLESFRQSLESQLPQGIDNGQAIPMTNCTKELLASLSSSDVWKGSNELADLNEAILGNNKEEVVRIIKKTK